MDKIASVKQDPCGHKILCVSCFLKITKKECPICRAVVLTRVYVTTQGLLWMYNWKNRDRFLYKDIRGLDAQYKLLEACSFMPRTSMEDIQGAVRSEWFKDNLWLVENQIEGGLLEIKWNAKQMVAIYFGKTLSDVLSQRWLQSLMHCVKEMLPLMQNYSIRHKAFQQKTWDCAFVTCIFAKKRSLTAQRNVVHFAKTV